MFSLGKVILGSAVIELKGRAIASGGEGSIHRHPSIHDRALKVFRQPSATRSAKLASMVAMASPNGSGRIICTWPEELAFAAHSRSRRHACVGYSMPLIVGAKSLYEVVVPHRRPARVDTGFLLTVGRNIASAMNSIHSHDVVIGDVNDMNVIVRPDGSVVFVDCDSYQIRAGGRVFRCLVGRPEFTSPELQGKSFRRRDRDVHCDYFALGVIEFRLLMEGNHPFSSGCSVSGTRLHPHELIARGLWPHRRGGVPGYPVRKACPPLSSLSAPLQEMMRRCFEEGCRNRAARPSPTEWVQVLDDALVNWKPTRRSRRKVVVPMPRAVKHVSTGRGRGAIGRTAKRIIMRCLVLCIAALAGLLVGIVLGTVESAADWVNPVQTWCRTLVGL